MLHFQSRIHTNSISVGDLDYRLIILYLPKTKILLCQNFYHIYHQIHLQHYYCVVLQSLQVCLKKQHENIKGKLACAECSYRTSSKRNLRIHVLKHTNKYICEKCNLKYGNKFELVYHLKKKHPEMPEEDWPIKRITQKEGNISCPETDCSYKTNSKKLLHDHRIQHTDRYKCENCHHRYGRKGDLVMHKSNPENCQKYLKLREFSCLECGKRYKDKFSLTRHEIAIH